MLVLRSLHWTSTVCAVLFLCCGDGCNVYDLNSLGNGGGAGGSDNGPSAGPGGSGVGGGASASNDGGAGGETAGGPATSGTGSPASGTGGLSGTGGASTSGGMAGSGSAVAATSTSGAGGASGPGGASGVGGSSGPGGGGGTSSGSGGSSVAGSSGAGGAVALDLIDDLEDGNAAIRVVSTPTRDGIWDTANDMSAGGMQTPPPSMFSPIALGRDVPYAGDKYAAYTQGSGFGTYGAFMNVTMRSWPDYAMAPTYDASGYVGLSFWAKVGPRSTSSVRVRFVSADTDPRGGKCKTAGSTGQLCYNHFYEDVPLRTSWARYQIRFSDFVQGNSGEIFPAVNLGQMYGLEFYFLSGTNFEVWIDDLSFIKK